MPSQPYAATTEPPAAGPIPISGIAGRIPMMDEKLKNILSFQDSSDEDFIDDELDENDDEIKDIEDLDEDLDEDNEE